MLIPHRSVYVDYNKTTYVKGIKTYHFVPPATVFMDHIKNPNNTGFCVPECLGSGVLDVSSCKSAPIIVSQPHFYQGSPKYINAIIGMNPGPDHATFVDVEPVRQLSMPCCLHTSFYFGADVRDKEGVCLRH